MIGDDRQLDQIREAMVDLMGKKLTLASSVIFTILAVAGAGYVLLNGGNVNAGYAGVPMVLALVSISFYRKYR